MQIMRKIAIMAIFSIYSNNITKMIENAILTNITTNNAIANTAVITWAVAENSANQENHQSNE